MYSLDEIKKETARIAQRHGVEEVGLFGSYARGEATEQSDLDFLIKKGEIRTLLGLIAFIQDLEECFDCHVDVITDQIDDQDILQEARNDEVKLYVDKRRADPKKDRRIL